jgi:hypothetical protein
MYHPELYPELALKNKLFERLRIPSEELFLNKEKNNINKYSKEENLNINSNSNKNFDNNINLRNLIIEDVIKKGQEKKLTEKSPSLHFIKAYKKAVKEKQNYKPELASNFHIIESIKEEINKTGEIYLGVNNFKNRKDVIDNYMNIFEAQKKSSFYEFNEFTKTLEHEKFNIKSKYSPSINVEKNREKYFSASAPLLEDLVDELKSENRIDSILDMSGIPSTENSLGKIVKDPQENLKKIKQYFDKMEILKAKNHIKKSKKDGNNITQKEKSQKIRNKI